MKLLQIAFAAGLALACFPYAADAQLDCTGFLTQQSFYPEMKEFNQKIQDNVIAARKIEEKLTGLPKDGAEAAELNKRHAAIMAELKEQKKVFEELNSKYFPRTELNALGAACQDLRWVDQAKAFLFKHREKLGGKYYVWLAKGTREFRAAKVHPGLEAVEK